MVILNLILPTKHIIQLKSDSTLIFDNLAKAFLSAYTPGLVFSDDLTLNPDFIVSHVESDKKSVELKDKELTIYDSWNGKISFDLYPLVYSIARKLFLIESSYSIHSSCVDKNGLILIVGHAGSGKTTTALNLVTKHGAKWASGNKTLLRFNDSKILAVAGTETTTIKQSDEPAYIDFIGDRLPYFDRLAFNLKDEFSYRFTSQSFLRKSTP